MSKHGLRILVVALTLLFRSVAAADVSPESVLTDLGRRASISLQANQLTATDSSQILLQASFTDGTSRDMILGSAEPWQLMNLYVVDANGKLVDRNFEYCRVPNNRKYSDFYVKASSTTVLGATINSGFFNLGCYGYKSLPAGKYTLTAQLLASVRIHDPSQGYLGGEHTLSRTPIRSNSLVITIAP